MLIPGQLSQLDEDHLRNSIRSAVTNYTGIYPFQVGNIKVHVHQSAFVVSLFGLCVYQFLLSSLFVGANDYLFRVNPHLKILSFHL